MIENTKCDCGHNNPVGTVLCEYCGKPLDEEIDLPKQMRYEGRARRSQTASMSIVDRVWSFFSSVKVAIILIVITLVVAGIGTIRKRNLFLQRHPRLTIKKNMVYGEMVLPIGIIYIVRVLGGFFFCWR